MKSEKVFDCSRCNNRERCLEVNRDGDPVEGYDTTYCAVREKCMTTDSPLHSHCESVETCPMRRAWNGDITAPYCGANDTDECPCNPG